MKILHTADWHLGKRLDSFSRLEEQVRVMEEIVAIADEQEADLVLVAGDLFDNFNPPVDAVELFYKTLKRLSKNGARPVIAISGNHDAPGLIDAPNPLAKACGIILIGQPNALVSTYELEQFSISRSDKGFIELRLNHLDYPVRILHTAYANEQRLKENLGEDKEASLNRLLADNWQKLADTYCDKQGVNLLLAHLYMNKQGAAIIEEPEGEKPIKIGNATMIYSEAIPAQVQYTALGHIHGFKNIGTEEKPVIYASSPLCYSFSEAGQEKYVNIVELQPGENARYQRITLQSGRPLYRKTFDNIDTAVEWLSQNKYALVELTLESDTFLNAAERKSIYQSHDGIIFLIPKLKADGVSATNATEVNLNQDMQSLFKDYFRSRHGQQEPNEELMNLFNEILNS
ncbi:MAG: exonuclease sbcCD subunit D [Bacteroidetes bacterium 43-16]|nr:MAG: exonuclease sbcCD subunit D [Bacteroidetes bacterium 43-16]